MSKTNTKHHQSFYRHPIFWVVLVILILATVAAVIIVTTTNYANQNAPTIGTGDEGSSQTVISDDETTQNPTNVDNKTSSPQLTGIPDDKVTQYEGTNVNNMAGLSGSISYAGVNDGVLTVRVTIAQFLSDTGTCTLTLTGKTQGKTYSTTNRAFADISSSACETFSVPLSNLPSDTYNLKVYFNGDNKTGFVEQEINL